MDTDGHAEEANVTLAKAKPTKDDAQSVQDQKGPGGLNKKSASGSKGKERKGPVKARAWLNNPALQTSAFIKNPLVEKGREEDEEGRREGESAEPRNTHAGEEGCVHAV